MTWQNSRVHSSIAFAIHLKPRSTSQLVLIAGNHCLRPVLSLSAETTVASPARPPLLELPATGQLAALAQYLSTYRLTLQIHIWAAKRDAAAGGAAGRPACCPSGVPAAATAGAAARLEGGVAPQNGVSRIAGCRQRQANLVRPFCSDALSDAPHRCWRRRQHAGPSRPTATICSTR